MSFGRNPHVAKALAEEEKGQTATDDDSRQRAYRDAARQWDRAAARELPGKRRLEYEASATRARALADAPAESANGEAGAPATGAADRRLLN